MKTDNIFVFALGNRIVLRILLFIFSFLPLFSCRMEKDDLMQDNANSQDAVAEGGFVSGALRQQTDGTWKAMDARVPLVGAGRVVNMVSGSSVDLITVDNELGNLVDTDIDNWAESGVAVKADIYSPIVSVRDIYRKYSLGQKVGFVYRESGSLLGVTLVKSFVIKLFMDGAEVQEIKAYDGDGGLLNLDLLSIGGSDGKEYIVAGTAEKAFDEVRLYTNGVGVDALKSIKLKYAFVGENPMEIKGFKVKEDYVEGYNYSLIGVIPTLKEVKWEDTPNAIDDNLTNSAYINIPSSNLTGKTATFGIDYDRTIEEGSEVGFVYSIKDKSLVGNLLGLDVLKQSPNLYLYNENETQVGLLEGETEVLGVGLLSGSSTAVLSMKANEPFRYSKYEYVFGTNLLGLLESGNLCLHYSYIRKPVEVDLSSYFAFPDMTVYTDMVYLPQPAEGKGTVTYTLSGAPYGSGAEIIGTVLEGVSKEGAYTVDYEYVYNGKVMQGSAVVYRMNPEGQKGCNNYVTEESNGAYISEPKGWDGGTLVGIGGKLSNPSAVIDSDQENYAARSGVLELVSTEPVMAVSFGKSVNPYGHDIRTGFVIQPNAGLLNLSLLKNYKIKLYKGEELVQESGTMQPVGLDLVSGGDGKIRIYVGTDKEFDHIELWYSKLLDLLQLDDIKVFSIFQENLYCESRSVPEACMEVMTDMTHGLSLDYMNSGGLLGVGGSVDGLGYLLDGDLNTGVDISATLELLKKDMPIALTFDRQKANTSIGVVIEDRNSLLNLNLLSGTKIEVYDSKNPAEPVDELLSFDALDLDLLRSDGRLYLELVPQKEYDRIVVTMGSSLAELGIGGGIKVLGLYTRRDSDGDGIPDCAEVNEHSYDVAIGDEYHICEGDVLEIDVVTDAPLGTEFALEFTDLDTDNIIMDNYSLVASSAGSAAKSFYVKNLPKGRYEMKLYTYGSSAVKSSVAYVHPHYTEWIGSAGNGWNEWSNWSEGSPWKCTNVFLPAGAPSYPILSPSEGNHCANIHFEDGALLTGSHLLTYGKAFIEMEISGGVEQWKSVPLQDVVSGDMFVNTSVVWSADRKFTVLDALNYPEKRTSPVVYQKMYGGELAYEFDLDGNSTNVSAADWSAEFNGVAASYLPGTGFCIRAGNSPTASYRFNFPKNHREYGYYSTTGTPTGQREVVPRGSGVGRLFDGSLNVSLQKTGVLIGNPYMACLDVSTLFGYSGLDRIIYFTEDGIEVSVSKGTDGTLVYTSAASQVPVQIHPLQAFMAFGNGTFVLNPEMQSDYDISFEPAACENGLRISASMGNSTSSCTLISSDTASDSVLKGEDVEKMLVSSVEPEFEFFMLSEGKALEVEKVCKKEKVFFGVYSKYKGNVTVNVDYVSEKWSEWEFVDSETGISYDLGRKNTRFVLRDVSSSSSRFYLHKK